MLKAAGYCCKFLSAAVLDSMRTMTGGILWLLGLNTCNFDTVLLVDIPSQTHLTHFLSGGKNIESIEFVNEVWVRFFFNGWVNRENGKTSK